MKHIKTVLIALLVFGSLNVKAANTDTLKQGAFNFALVYPLSVHGISSKDKEFNFSLNALGGYSGSIKGCEIAGLWNLDRKDMKGFQVAGLANVVGEKVQGFQVAGLVNTAKSVEGSQISGLVSSASQDFSGLQISGLVSFAKDLSNDKPAVPKFNSQISGLVNVGVNFDQHVQIAGLVNTGERITGTQIAGLVNTSTAVKGAQIAGLVNENNENIQGIQIAGLVNKAKVVNGMQIGLINISDSVNGNAIGLLNFSKNVKYHWDVMASDAFFANVRFTSGFKDFYTIITLSGKYTDDVYWGYGIGGGLFFNEKEKSRSFVEFNWSHVTEGELWNKQYNNHLYSVSRGWEWNVNDKQMFRLAPTLNMYMSRTKDNKGNALEETNFPTYNILKVDPEDGTSRLDFWVGLNVSYRFRTK